ncbi:MAG TPA: methylenetetrahydrofolate reductase [NAD(P)H] [Opitutae bacterium]|nr:methylenetetrahydrofolate reductase [NAD(P)H] [Opitutaceae bacterium]HCR28729.1 methylenetetrahydrofolate reductase [NAD(P)H] [Opitutae bacterium]
MFEQKPIIDLLDSSVPTLSVEFFPPKSQDGVESLVDAASRIASRKPDFVSVTYGAGGSTRDLSASVSERMKNDIDLQVMPHLTCVGSTKEELATIVDGFYQDGYRNIMALRGDPPKGQEAFVRTEGGFSYASDLVAFIKSRHPDICLGIAGYPEKHPEAPSMDSDLDTLKVKADAGGSFITTQLFFDNAVFFQYMEKVQSRGIQIPIVPGIMPVLSLKQIKRITQLCQSSLPNSLESQLSKVESDPEAVRRLGVEWAAAQIEDLLANGVPGIHIYALNKARSAIELIDAARR